MSVRGFGRLLVLLAISTLALQCYFAARIALMRFVDPASTTFERSEAWRLSREPGTFNWHQQWSPYGRIASNLKRAVIASEDAGFVDHGGVEWDALQHAWDRNLKAEVRAGRLNEAFEKRHPNQPAARLEPKVVGGSTITQQLAKNLFLDGERNFVRKGQEFVLAMMLEACLDKRRILELYLNHVEWGAGVFGAEAAARRYFGSGAEALSPTQAARLAVMLPAPKRLEKRPGSPYLVGRSAVVAARMGAVDLPE